jgi:hypothetical protein
MTITMCSPMVPSLKHLPKKLCPSPSLIEIPWILGGAPSSLAASHVALVACLVWPAQDQEDWITVLVARNVLVRGVVRIHRRLAVGSPGSVLMGVVRVHDGMLLLTFCCIQIFSQNFTH